MKTILLLPVLFFLLSCSHRPVNLPASHHEKSLYELGLKALSKSDFAQAQAKFSTLLSEFPTTRWLPGAYYNLGLSLEGLQKFPEAAEKYKKVVDFYQGLHTRDSADALYRLSICYESMGDDPKMILTLLQLNEQPEYLGRDLVEAELPARLAAAYARQGNLDQAKIYYAKADAGLKRMKRSRVPSDAMIWLPKTFFSMGHIPLNKLDFKTVTEFKNFLESLRQAQVWLLRAAEWGHKEWSPKAADDLVTAYGKSWQFIDNLPLEENADKMLALKKKQETQRELAGQLDSLIESLKLEHVPPSPSFPETAEAKSIFSNLSGMEKRIALLLQSPDIQDQNTKEAQSREGLKRRGRMKK